MICAFYKHVGRQPIIKGKHALPVANLTGPGENLPYFFAIAHSQQLYIAVPSADFFVVDKKDMNTVAFFHFTPPTNIGMEANSSYAII